MLLSLISMVRFYESDHIRYNWNIISATKLAKLCWCAVCVRFQKPSRVLRDVDILKVSSGTLYTVYKSIRQ